MTEQVSLFHLLDDSGERPERMNNPFCYTPHPLCKRAVTTLCHSPYFKQIEHEAAQGKMFGVLVAEDKQGQLGFIAAYSGQIDGRSNWPGFVPAVFDYLQPDGHFKQQEAVISSLNKKIETMETAPDYLFLLQERQRLQKENLQIIEAFKHKMEVAKRKREHIRQQSDANNEALIRESQFMKAELRRIKKRQAEQAALLEQQINDVTLAVTQLKKQRRQLSDELQHWLFCQFRMLNQKGERKDLTEIFADTVFKTPPAGAGECCEPKLLQYAFEHRLQPLNMAMFWYGISPKTEVRHHLHYYPACNGKCKPILSWMLGPEVCGNRLQKKTAEPVIRYEDDTLLVIEKPSGLLSVPGKGMEPSVESIMRHRCAETEGPFMVHRLDQDTSGLMVITKTTAAYHHLQRQFAEHTIVKHYIARLAHPLTDKLRQQPHGIIRLPLWADPLDRPYQKVDFKKGKKAETTYRILNDNIVELTPHTGRTHQLRVHCAHQDGLGNPILGDTLYGDGTPAARLCLHASYLSFTHPATGLLMEFLSEADFSSL